MTKVISPTPEAVDEIVGEHALAGIWFRTNPLAWHTRYVGPGTFPELLLLSAVKAYRYLRPARRTETETLLDHTGLIYCVRTRDEIVFVAFDDRIGKRLLTHVLRRFPSAALLSCDYDRNHKTEVTFRFDSDESLTLHFAGDWSDLADFITPCCTLDGPPKSNG